MSCRSEHVGELVGAAAQPRALLVVVRDPVGRHLSNLSNMDPRAPSPSRG